MQQVDTGISLTHMPPIGQLDVKLLGQLNLTIKISVSEHNE